MVAEGSMENQNNDFQVLYEELISQSKAGEYDDVDDRIVPAIAEAVDRDGIEELASEITSENPTIADAVIVVLKDKAVIEKIKAEAARDFGEPNIAEEIEKAMSAVLTSSEHPWPTVQALLYLLRYYQDDAQKYDGYLSTYESRVGDNIAEQDGSWDDSDDHVGVKQNILNNLHEDEVKEHPRFYDFLSS